MIKYSTVGDFINDLSDARKAEVNALRLMIKNAHPDASEHLKWNSSSFVLDGEDRLTFSMHHPDKSMLVLHRAATRKENKNGEPIMKDDSALITWKSDIRGTLSFTSLDQIETHKSQLEKIISQWLLLP
jgi:hypothetical protein